tara:strand:- start:550 stop:1563 length:1014 start_codon:yes stop_codon:yes gene_type:complete
MFLSKKKVFLAVFFGLLITVYLLYSEFKNADFKDQLTQINWGFQSFLFLSLAIFMMVLRDFAYMIRLRLLTDNKLTWKQALKIILMWEFASAVSPGVVGGSAVAMFFLNKEKIPLGKSTTLVIITALFDNLFYLTFVPLTFIFIDLNDLLPAQISEEYIKYFWFGYLVIFTVTILLGISLFLYPKLIKHILVLLYKLPYLNKRKQKGQILARDITIASKHIKGKSILFWFKLMGSTTLSWTARFLVVNCILMSFVSLDFQDNTVIIARQLLMWLLLLVTPTPGGSGMAEYLFGTFLGDYLPVGILVLLCSVLWRLISYYPYLFIGSVLIPKWFKKKY